LAPLGLAVCLSLFGDLTLYAVLVTQLDEIGLSLAAVGIMLSVNRLVRIPGNPLAGAVFDRWGRRRLFILGMSLGVLSTASYALVRGFWPFLIGRLAWGIAWTLINVGGLAIVLDVSTKANRGRLSGLYNTWVWMGLALGPLVGGFLVDGIGFRPAMLTCAGLTAVGLAVAVVALPETARSARSTVKKVKKPDFAEGFRKTRFLNRPRFLNRDLLHARQGLTTLFWLHLITQFAGEGVILSTITLLLQQRFGQRCSVGAALGGLTLGVASASGVLLGLRSLLASTVGPLAGHLSDTRTGRSPVIVSSLVAGIVGFGLLFYGTSLGMMVIGVVLGAVSGGAALATLVAQVGDQTPPGREGAVMGLYATAGDIGSTAGPFLAFALLSVVDLQWIYLLCTFTFLAGLWLIWHSRVS